ncbi:MAG: glucosidase [Burkholderiales bacterium]|nr:glucosidase [Burkholderiales bacterium]
MSDPNPPPLTAEEARLAQAREGKAPWRKWGPYLAERQWGTVREDYSADGTAWEYLPHDHARSRAYRWGEDGIAGICDDNQQLCFAPAFWNGADPILKERLFGLTNAEGNHGEDVKEYYFHLDNVPSHAYMKYLYKYPQRAFPYADLVAENARRTRLDPEYELLDTGIFEDDRYFDIVIEYAKADTTDLLIRISATNRAAYAAPLHIVPTLWFKNDWSWGGDPTPPRIAVASEADGVVALVTTHRSLPAYEFYGATPHALLFTENATNQQRLFGVANASTYVKDAFHDHIVGRRADAVNPARTGSKAALHYVFDVAAHATVSVELRLRTGPPLTQPFTAAFAATFDARKAEADAFYRRVTPFDLPDDLRNIQRQAFAGMLWNKQYYRYMVHRWLEGDPTAPPPPDSRLAGRNHTWTHMSAADVLSMPDKWEYPWFAAWDTAFHTIPLALIDPDFAKEQLILLTREWYMHPNGEIPAYEWAFSDVNPPVHAWAAMRIYQIEARMYGRADRDFLERVFQKLLINFTWWVNRKDADGSNIFEGGFLGLDNVSVFDRTSGLPSGGVLEQADSTSWMAMYCLNLLGIALELAKKDAVYEDIATKFFQHFVYIGAAINRMGDEKGGLWSEEDGYYYDVLKLPGGRCYPIRAQTISGLIPLFAVAVADRDALASFPDFNERVRWFTRFRPELLRGLGEITEHGVQGRVRVSLVDRDKLARVLRPVLDPAAMLSPHGVRSVSRIHHERAYALTIGTQTFTLEYTPGESTTPLFGGNSNWRGPVWFPLNYLLIEALQKHDAVLGGDFRVECPTGSGNTMTLWQVTTELTRRLIAIFARDENGRRPVHGDREKFQSDPYWRDLIPFHEYFHGDSGEGLGASHQCGWTGVVAKLIQQYGEYALNPTPMLSGELGLGLTERVPIAQDPR